MSVGKRIKQRRNELGMSGEELAKRLGKNRSTVFRYESGEIENMPLDILVPIAEALQTSPGYLMGWEEAEEKQKKNDAISDIVVKIRTDSNFCEAVELLSRLNEEQLSSIMQTVRLLLK